MKSITCKICGKDLTKCNFNYKRFYCPCNYDGSCNNRSKKTHYTYDEGLNELQEVFYFDNYYAIEITLPNKRSFFEYIFFIWEAKNYWTVALKFISDKEITSIEKINSEEKFLKFIKNYKLMS